MPFKQQTDAANSRWDEVRRKKAMQQASIKHAGLVKKRNVATEELERLTKRGGATKKEIDELTNKVAKIQEEIDQAKAGLEEMKSPIPYSPPTSPDSSLAAATAAAAASISPPPPIPFSPEGNDDAASEPENRGRISFLGHYFDVIHLADNSHPHSTKSLIARGIRSKGMYKRIVKAIVDSAAGKGKTIEGEIDLSLVRQLAVGRIVPNDKDDQMAMNSKLWLLEQTTRETEDGEDSYYFRPIIPPEIIDEALEVILRGKDITVKRSVWGIWKAIQPYMLNIIIKDIKAFLDQNAQDFPEYSACKHASEAKHFKPLETIEVITTVLKEQTQPRWIIMESWSRFAIQKETHEAAIKEIRKIITTAKERKLRIPNINTDNSMIATAFENDRDVQVKFTQPTNAQRLAQRCYQITSQEGDVEIDRFFELYNLDVNSATGYKPDKLQEVLYETTQYTMADLEMLDEIIRKRQAIRHSYRRPQRIEKLKVGDTVKYKGDYCTVLRWIKRESSKGSDFLVKIKMKADSKIRHVKSTDLIQEDKQAVGRMKRLTLDENVQPLKSKETTSPADVVTNHKLEDRIAYIENAQGYTMEIHDVKRDGNCQFHAVAFALQNQITVPKEIGEKHNYQTLRAAAVEWLRNNPNYRSIKSIREVNLFSYVGDFNGTWGDYVDRLSRNGEWGNEITLIALSSVLNVEINTIFARTGAPLNKSYTTTYPGNRDTGSRVSGTIWIINVNDTHYKTLDIRKAT